MDITEFAMGCTKIVAVLATLACLQACAVADAVTAPTHLAEIDRHGARPMAVR